MIILALVAWALVEHVESSVLSPIDCLDPTQVTRNCTIFETTHGGCLCPGFGTVRRFTLIITYAEIPGILPGRSKWLITANGTAPGPPIVVNEGDWVEVVVVNQLLETVARPAAITTMHWHGMLHVATPFNDGVPGVTQCEVAPGSTLTYGFRAANAGTYWYHGHAHEQYTDGLYGALVVQPLIARPLLATVADDWTLILSDYYNDDAFSLVSSFYLTPASDGVEPIPDAILVNGNLSRTLHWAAVRGSVTRLRFIAGNSLSMFSVSIDGVTLRVIEVDATATLPYEVDRFTLNCGQRVSVLVDWSQVPHSTAAVWLRVSAMPSMYAVNISGYIPPYEAGVPGFAPLDPDWLGVVQFAPLASAGRLTPAYGPLPAVNASGQPPTPAAAHPDPDPNLLDAQPEAPIAAPAPTHSLLLRVDFWRDGGGVEVGGFNGISAPHNAMEEAPALFGLMQPGAPYGSPAAAAAAANAALYPLSGAIPGRSPALPGIGYNAAGEYLLPIGAVVEVLIVNSDDEGEHPIHTHGHAFWVVATSDDPGGGNRSSDAARMMMRDTVSVPAAGGWAKIVIVADNPGVWTFHCHIDWHIDAGVIGIFVEAPERLLGLPIPATHLAACAALAPAASAGAAPCAPTAAIVGGGIAGGIAGVLLAAAAVYAIRNYRRGLLAFGFGGPMKLYADLEAPAGGAQLAALGEEVGKAPHESAAALPPPTTPTVAPPIQRNASEWT